jgi:hypothetical protein
MKPFIHARNSARKHGGTWEEYLKFHEWFDQTKAHIADMRHRAVLHNSFGIYLLEQVFGGHFTNSEGKLVSVRDIGEEHVLEDLGMIPSLSDCLKTMPLERMEILGMRKRTFHIDMHD